MTKGFQVMHMHLEVLSCRKKSSMIIRVYHQALKHPPGIQRRQTTRTKQDRLASHQKPFPRISKNELSRLSNHPRGYVSRRPKVIKYSTYINHTVAAGHESRSIAGEEHGEVVQLVGIAQPVLWRHGGPDLLLALQGRKAVQGRVHVPRRDAVDPDFVLGPFCGERFTQLDDGSFGGVVAGLLLWVVDDGAGHAGDEDDGTAGSLCDHLATTGLGNQKCTSDVDRDEVVPLAVVIFLRLDVRAVWMRR